MGLIMAALSSFSSTLADTWQEYFVCESLSSDILVAKAKKQGKNKGSENVITKGSKIVVHEGQAMIMVDQGIVIEIATEPGVYTYDAGMLVSGR